MSEKQVKSKERVAKHGEVFTAEREVKAMCDLVKQETERIESRFLEPACGNGNFLAEILSRKLLIVKKRYKKNPFDYERYSVLAVTSLYGVDIMEDNAQECRERLFNIWNKEYTANAKNQANDKCREAVKYIFEKNILCGDALTMLKKDGSPIIFAEWSLVMGSKIKRRDFQFSELLSVDNNDSLNFELGWEFDKELNTYLPSPIKEYKLSDYRRVQENE